MSLPKLPNPSQVVLELPPGYEGSGDVRPRSAEPTAVILASDILRWLIPKVGKFPKNVRFGLGARLEAAHFDVLEELIRAQYARGGGARAAALEFGNARLQCARHLGRMARELNLFSEESALHLARMQVDLGNQVGAWRRASVATANSSAHASDLAIAARVVARAGVPAAELRGRVRVALTRSTTNRVIRGGSWNNDTNNVRSSNRNNDTPGNTNNNIGFRVASTP